MGLRKMRKFGLSMFGLTRPTYTIGTRESELEHVIGSSKIYLVYKLRRQLLNFIWAAASVFISMRRKLKFKLKKKKILQWNFNKIRPVQLFKKSTLTPCFSVQRAIDCRFQFWCVCLFKLHLSQRKDSVAPCVGGAFESWNNQDHHW